MQRYVFASAAAISIIIAISATGCSNAVENLKSPDRTVVIAAIREIGTWDSASAAKTLAEFAKDQADGVLAIEAIRGIGKMRCDEAVKALEEFASQDKRPAVRREAVTQMSYRRDEAQRKLFEQLARTDPDPQVRATAISAVLQFKSLKDVAMFLELARQEQDDVVQARAVGAIEKLIQLRTGYNPAASAQERQRVIDDMTGNAGRSGVVAIAARLQRQRDKEAGGNK